jgi:hypothetical protein
MKLFKKKRKNQYEIEGSCATFVNLVKIIEVTDIDYIIHFYNTYSKQEFIFRVYKKLLDKAMEIRKIIDLEVTVAGKQDEETGRQEGEGATLFI